jgi:hypothetical protein
LHKSFVENVTEFFKPQAPLWACEVTAKHLIVAGVNGRRTRVAQTAVSDVPDSGNIAALRPVVRQLLSQVGFKGSEIAVVVPDEIARISFLTAEKPSKNAEEQRSFIRWKLKKSVPFDVDTAQIAYRILGPHPGGSGVNILVALTPTALIQEYETLFDELDVQAGIVIPSTLALLNLFDPPQGDVLFVKKTDDGVTTTIFQKQRVQFYRRVSQVTLYDAVYPTLLYYQDKLGGQAFERLYACGYDESMRPDLDEVHQKLGLQAQRVDPKSIEDIYKPALGAIHLKPEAVV